MNALITIVRILVGALFIFSGLVKANDPLGLSYKMQEFFELWGMGQFNNITLTLSVLMIAIEIIAGFALLIGWKMRLFSWLLLLLIIFFTFLTGYADLSGKFKNCGCFGDCFPISARTSFIKDIVLLVLIGFLFANRNRIRPLFSNKVSIALMSVVTLFSFGIQWYVLTHLPVFDCLPYKRNNNIPEQMKMPANAIPDSVVIYFQYKKDGKLVEFTADNFPENFDSTYTDMKRIDKVVRKGKNNEPAIKGFALLTDSNTDTTAFVLDQPHAILLFSEKFSTPIKKWQNQFADIYQDAKKKNIPVFLVTTSSDKAREEIKGTAFSDITVLKCDFTAIRTAARADPTVYVLEKGTISGKWSYAQMEEAIEHLKGVKPIPTAPVTDSLPKEPVIN